MSDELVKLQLKIAELKSAEREAARLERARRYADAEAARLASHLAARARREQEAAEKLAAREDRRKGSPEYKARRHAELLEAGYRYYLCWGHKGAFMVFMSPSDAVDVSKGRLTPDMTDAERCMNIEQFHALTQYGPAPAKGTPIRLDGITMLADGHGGVLPKDQK